MSSMEVLKMIESKGWEWKLVKDDENCIWKNPSIESYYLLNRWKSQGKKEFLDLGCGLGRHSILFGKNGFQVSCFDISADAVNKTKEWAQKEGINCEYLVGDMLNMPYHDEQFDCVFGRNVISHSDTEGVKQIINHLFRILKKGGECYVTLGSKETWGFKQTNWPLVDPNTKLRMEEGEEYKVPHFYADYNLIKELFSKFEIIKIFQEIEYNEKEDKVNESYHYHVLVRKQ